MMVINPKLLLQYSYFFSVFFCINEEPHFFIGDRQLLNTLVVLCI